jgi:hypothetical protein
MSRLLSIYINPEEGAPTFQIQKYQNSQYEPVTAEKLAGVQELRPWR